MNITAPEQWQAERLQGIGASEASAVIGKNPWMSNVDLWRIKTGRKAAEDISDKACVQYGHDAEPLIRGLFALDYKDIYKVEYRGAFDMVRSAQHPFIFATLDGRLTETATGRLGCMRARPPKSCAVCSAKNGARRTGAPAYRTTTMCRCCISCLPRAGNLPCCMPSLKAHGATNLWPRGARL